MRDLKIIFFLVSIMTMTSETYPGGSPEEVFFDSKSYEEDSSPEKTDISAQSTLPSSKEPTRTLHSSLPQTKLAPSSSSSSLADTDDLKCKYLYKVLTHMKVTALQLNDFGHWESLIIKIRHYKVNDAITLLYENDANSIGSLWGYYLYKSWTIRERVDQFIDIIKQTNLRNTHKNVIKLLEYDLRITKCPKDHPNNLYDQWIKKHPNPKPKDITSMVMKNHKFNCMNVIRKHCGSSSGHVNLNDALKLDSLFLNGLGNNHNHIVRLENFGFTGINWTGTRRLLNSSWDNIWNKFNMDVEHYKKIKLFFTLHNDFFNIIILRLSSIHLLNIDEISGENHKSNYAKQLNTLLNDYKRMLVIQDDTTLNYLLKITDQIAKKNGGINIKETTSQLQTNAESMCSVLVCSVILNISQLKTLKDDNDKLIKTTNEKSNKETDLPTLNGTDPLKNVKDFLTIIRDIFKGMNLNVTRSFFSHINNMSLAPVELFKQNRHT